MKTQVNRTGIRAILANQQGVAFVLLVVSMVALASAAALAIDVGLLVTARSESQRAADASALAGASALLDDPDDSVGAVARAIDYASRNTIRGDPATVLDEDVIVMLDESKVRVYVENSSARSNPIGTFFARIFGVGAVDVRTMATAEAAPATGVEPSGAIEDCLLPIGLLDYYDADGDGTYTPGSDPALGFGQGDHHGKLLKLSYSGSTPAGPPQCQGEPTPPVFNANPDVDYCNGYEDSWSCWWRENEHDGGGSTDLGQAILGNNCATVGMGDQIWQASAGGEKQSLIQSDYESGGPGSFRDLIEMDLADNNQEDLVWCDSGNNGPAFGCAQRGGCTTNADACVTSGHRMRVAPIIDTSNISGSGANNTFNVAGFTGVFIERVACRYDQGLWGGPEGQWEVYVRLYTANVGDSGDDDDPPGDDDSLIRYLRLIE